MREENYFEKKLENSRETLAMAKRNIEHFDVQMNLLKIRFDHDKKVYNDQMIHMQNIVKDMKKRIPILEKKIEEGYTTIDMKTGKAYKSFKERHIKQLEDKKEWALENYKKLEANYKRKQELRKKRKLKPEEAAIVKAEEIRESLQGEDEIKEVHEKSLERLQQKADHYDKELSELLGIKPPKETKIEEPPPLELDEPTEGEAYIELTEAQKLEREHHDWIVEYAEEEGGNAIWQGNITKGFKAWCLVRGYKIGE